MPQHHLLMVGYRTLNALRSLRKGLNMKIISVSSLFCVSVIFICAQASQAQSVVPRQEPTLAELDFPAGALSALQAAQLNSEDAFVPQGELDSLIHSGGGGACPSAAAIDVLQALRVMAGLERLSNPYKAVLAAFAQQKDLLDGRLTNEQFVGLLQFYADNYLPGCSIRIDIELSPRGPHSPTGHTWPENQGPDLQVEAHQLKIVTYTVTTASGKLLGRHFVLLKRRDGNDIFVVDPKSPSKDRHYVVSCMVPEQGGCGHMLLLQPPGQKQRTELFEVNAVFAITLNDKADEAGQPILPQTLAELERRIDVAAAELSASGDLRSPRKWRKATASFGLPGLDLPPDLGGGGWPAAKMLEVFMHAGRHDLNCRDIVGGAHARLLLDSQSPEVLDIVRQVTAGRAYMAVTMTEPNVGSDFHAITSTARKVDGGYSLTGEKRYVARLEQATHVVIFTQPASGEPQGLSAFVLPINTPGLEPYSFGAHGLKGNSFGGLRFTDVRVADWQLIGADGEGDDIFIKHFRYWRLMQVGAALGTAERALEMMAERLSAREAFGGPIGRFTHLQQALGQYTTELRMAKALAREAADLLDRGEYTLADPLINGLKAEGVEIALRAVDAATRAFGAEGYSDRVDLGDRLQDLNGLRIADGTTDVMRMDVVRRSFKNGKELWDMAVRGR
jgi:alkylation response protein AidB-like acyl-CoA dehydrogenase